MNDAQMIHRQQPTGKTDLAGRFTHTNRRSLEMRTYPTNSPQASARIVALAMLADGHLCKSELDAVNGAGIEAQLGLQPAELQTVMHTLCEDLLITANGQWEDACKVDADTLAALLEEISDPDLRSTVLRLCVTAVAADEHLADSENAFLTSVTDYWGSYGSQQNTAASPRRADHV
ncbi:MAG: tellurite resistance TerB family protein [Betaproteobacteria bacterium]